MMEHQDFLDSLDKSNRLDQAQCVNYALELTHVLDQTIRNNFNRLEFSYDQLLNDHNENYKKKLQSEFSSLLNVIAARVMTDILMADTFKGAIRIYTFWILVAAKSALPPFNNLQLEQAIISGLSHYLVEQLFTEKNGGKFFSIEIKEKIQSLQDLKRYPHALLNQNNYFPPLFLCANSMENLIAHGCRIQLYYLLETMKSWQIPVKCDSTIDIIFQKLETGILILNQPKQKENKALIKLITEHIEHLKLDLNRNCTSYLNIPLIVDGYDDVIDQFTITAKNMTLNREILIKALLEKEVKLILDQVDKLQANPSKDQYRKLEKFLTKFFCTDLFKELMRSENSDLRDYFQTIDPINLVVNYNLSLTLPEENARLLAKKTWRNYLPCIEKEASLIADQIEDLKTNSSKDQRDSLLKFLMKFFSTEIFQKLILERDLALNDAFQLHVAIDDLDLLKDYDISISKEENASVLADKIWKSSQEAEDAKLISPEIITPVAVENSLSSEKIDRVSDEKSERLIVRKNSVFGRSRAPSDAKGWSYLDFRKENNQEKHRREIITNNNNNALFRSSTIPIPNSENNSAETIVKSPTDKNVVNDRQDNTSKSTKDAFKNFFNCAPWHYSKTNQIGRASSEPARLGGGTLRAKKTCTSSSFNVFFDQSKKEKSEGKQLSKSLERNRDASYENA